ncbi:hypothetical protein ACFL96_14915 [Thermoproteota archaeon]
MKGKLEVACGPSGVGKTSELSDDVRAYRWTTRDPRANELLGIDGKEYTLEEALEIRENEGRFQSMIGGSFATDSRFDEAIEGLVGVHRYPDPDTGKWYGYPTNEIEDALESGELVGEQVVDFDAFLELTKKFPSAKKILCMADLQETRKRLLQRSSNIDLREGVNLDNIIKYLSNIEVFDWVSVSAAEYMTDEDLIRKEIETLKEQVENDQEITIEYDMPDHTIRDFIQGYAEGRKTKEDVLEMTDNLLEHIKKMGVLRKTYPTLKESGQFTKGTYMFLREEHDAFNVPFLGSLMLRDLGYVDESRRIMDKLYTALDDTRTGRHTSDTIIDYFVRECFIGSLSEKMKNYDNEKFHVHIVRGLSPVGKDLEKILKMNREGGLDAAKRGFHAMQLGNLMMRYLITPGLEEMNQLRVINCKNLVDKNIEGIPKEADLYQAHLAYLFAFFNSFDLNTENSERMTHMTRFMRLRLSDIYEDPSNVGKGIVKDTDYLSFALANYLTAQDCVLSMMSHERHLKIGNEISAAHTMRIADGLVNTTFKLAFDENLPGFMSDSGAYAAWYFLDTAMNIMESDPDLKNIPSNINSYPVTLNPLQFLNMYWIHDFLPSERYAQLFLDRLRVLEKRTEKADLPGEGLRETLAENIVYLEGKL